MTETPPNQDAPQREPQLTREAKEAIREYMLRLVALPGIAGVVVAFLLGFFIRDVAVKQAQYEAYNKVSSDVVQLAQDTQTQKDKLTTLSNTVTQVADRLSSLTANVDRAELQLTKLLKDPDVVINALEALAKYPNEKAIAAKVEQLDKLSLRSQVEPFVTLQMGTETTGADVPKAQNGEHTQTFQFPGEVVATGVVPRATANPAALDEISYLQAHVDANDNRKVHLRCRSRRANSHQEIPSGDHRIDGFVWAVYKQ